MYSPAIQKLIKAFSRFPTVGPRVASRFVFYLLQLSSDEINDLISDIRSVRGLAKACSFCFNYFEGEGDLCDICKNPVRDKKLLCVVEKEADLESLEKIKTYRGRYFILGGTVSTLKKSDIDKLRTKELQETIKNNPEIEELIIAINPTVEGQATTLYLERFLKNLGKKISKLGLGLPLGGEVEYADEETLASALENRK